MSLQKRATETEADIKELKDLMESASRQKVKEILGIDLRRLETQLSSLKVDIGKANNRLQEQESKKSSVEGGGGKTPEYQIKNYSWDQSEKFVSVYLTGLAGLPALDQDKIKVTFAEQAVSVRVEDLNGKTFLFNINKTCHKIIPDKSSFKVKSDYLRVYLCKLNPGSSWSHFTAAEKAAADATKKSEPKMDESDPSAGLMNMMKKMYDEGDDDMKRTIAKAWTEGQDKKMGGGAGMPDMPSMPGMPDMPSMPGMPDMSGLGGL